MLLIFMWSLTKCLSVSVISEMFSKSKKSKSISYAKTVEFSPKLSDSFQMGSSGIAYWKIER